MPGLTWKPMLAETLRPLLRTPHVGEWSNGPHAAHGTDALVASYNIHKCVGQDGIFDPRRIIAVIAEIGADIVALQEVDQRFGGRAGLLDLRALHDSWGLVPAPIKPTRKGHGWHGNLVLCREGLVKSARQLALPGVEPRGALVIDLTLTGGPLRLIAAHLGLLRRSREIQVKTLLSVMRAEPDLPTLLTGDLNEWRLGGRSALRALDAAFHSPCPPVPSFPAGFPVLALDRIMGNQPSLIMQTTVHDTALSRMASDHLPIKARVRLPQAASRQARAA